MAGEQMELGLRGSEYRPARSPGWRDLLRDREVHSWELIRNLGGQRRHHLSNYATYILDDAICWLDSVPEDSLHAIVTDPPYGVLEYEQKNHDKLRSGRGGVWRIPPSFDGEAQASAAIYRVVTRGPQDTSWLF
jgi:site-specific DNA-methyltransferase (adenine-specific)